MRIGLAIEHFDPRRGGVEQWTWQFVRRLLADGHELHLASSSFCKAAASLPLVRHLLPRTRSRLAWAEAAETALRPLGLDVVHDTGAGWFCNVFQPHGGSRQASFEQNQWLLPAWRRPLRRVAARWLPRYRQFALLTRHQYTNDGRLIVALSQRVARDMAAYHDVDPRRIRIVYNGVDTRRFAPPSPEKRAKARAALKLTADQVAVLIVAHNFELKGVPALVSATGKLLRRGVPLRLFVAGGRGITPRYRRLAFRHGAAEAVEFLGPVDDPTELYAAADIYAQPTWYDPCSLVVLEALAAGLPVITTAANGAGELITPGAEGEVLADPSDVDALAEALARYCDPAIRQDACQAARQLALEHDLERNYREMLAIYAEARPAARRAA